MILSTTDPNIVTIEAGDVGADYVALRAPVTIPSLLAANVRYAIRYIARRTSIGKIITPAEIVQLHDAGIAVLLNYEGGEGDYTGGASAGAANGAWSRDFARSLGYPDGLPLFVSIDTDIYANNRATAGAYTRAFMVNANPYRAAVYGDVDVMQTVADLAPITWRANATGWGAVPAGLTVHIQQGRANVTTGTDPNMCQAPFEAWLPHMITPPPPPPPENDDMTELIQPTNDAAIFLRDGLVCTWVADGNVLAALTSAGIVGPGVARPVTRLALKALELHGPAPAYGGGTPASQPERTKTTDFATWRP